MSGTGRLILVLTKKLSLPQSSLGEHLPNIAAYE